MAAKMTIQYRAVIFVGLPKKILLESDKQILDKNILNSNPPCDNGLGIDKSICGYELCGSFEYLPDEFVFDKDKCDALKERFYRATELDAKVYIFPKEY